MELIILRFDGKVSGNGKYCFLTEVSNVEEIAQDLYTLYTDKVVYEKYVQLSLERSKAFLPDVISEQIKNLVNY